ncbi:uncharacterized protein TNCV_2446121 [Trichonephila clavipes]|nr:uncharacterized protein TNCV_2446121 [Trichonephila clavipes]
MNINFVPSLSHIALTKIAIQVSNDPEVRCFEDDLGFPVYLLPSKILETLLFNLDFSFALSSALLEKLVCLTKPESFNIKQLFYDRYESLSVVVFSAAASAKSFREKLCFPLCILHSKKWEKLVKKKVSTYPISANLQEKVADMVRHVNSEVEKWFLDHSPITCRTIDMRNIFIWKSNGSIDRVKTAEVLVQVERLNISKRFIVASFYCLEGDVISLWNKMTEKEKRRCCDISSSLVVRIWIKWLQDGEQINWRRLAWSSVLNPLGVRCFFLKLRPNSKKSWLAASLRLRTLQNDDLLFCLSHLDRKRRSKVFEKCASQVLESFLEWPFQSSFLKMSDYMWNFLKEEEFRNLLHLILYQKVLVRFGNFDYLQLLKEFWEQSPPEYKEYALKNSLSTPLSSIIRHKCSKSVLKKELSPSSSVQDYMHFEALGIQFRYFLGGRSPDINSMYLEINRLRYPRM